MTAERVNPSADLLTAWLRNRLKVDIDRKSSGGPGHHRGGAGDRATGRSGSRGRTAGWRSYSSPGHPDRPIALRRRDAHELLAEELRRLDEDDVYAAVAKTLTKSRSL